MIDRPARGVVLLVVGLAVLAGTLTVGAVTAPDRAIANSDSGPTLVGSQGGGPGLHERGSVYLVADGSIQWRSDSADSYFDVTRLPNGSVLAGFMHSGYTTGCAPYDSPCTKTGFRIIDPDGPRVVSEYSYPVRSRGNSETHDVEHLASGEYLISDMEHERLVTVKNGSETWEWRAAGFYDAPPDPTKRDWLHINDVDAINETHYLVSVRNANQILLIERGAGVVEVINKDRDDADDESCQLRGNQLADFDGDGDIRCGDPAVMDHQHNPQWLGDGAVLVADSGNDRAVELHRTEDGRWEPKWSLSDAGGSELSWPRDADRLDNGNTLITDSLNKRILEVTRNGTVAWSTRTPADSPVPYEAERLPEGERVGAGSYAAGTVEDEEPNGSVPLLSPLLVGVRTVAPWTPFWLSEGHLAVMLLGLVGVGVGSTDWYRQRP